MKNSLQRRKNMILSFSILVEKTPNKFKIFLKWTCYFIFLNQNHLIVQLYFLSLFKRTLLRSEVKIFRIFPHFGILQIQDFFF